MKASRQGCTSRGARVVRVRMAEGGAGVSMRGAVGAVVVEGRGPVPRSGEGAFGLRGERSLSTFWW